MAKLREYCCCAIPTVNTGIYAILIIQLVAGVLVGVLSFATPDIVGAATPEFAKWVFGIVCLVGAVVQLLGMFGVAKTSTIIFRRYVSLHSLAMVAAFAVGAVWIIMSATRHNTAKSDCIRDFFDANDDVQQSEAQTMCEIFPWVDVGIMGGLWALLAIMFIYFYVVILSYNSTLQSGGLYDSLNDSKVVDDIPMNNRDPWDSRDSSDHQNRGYGHYRDQSAASISDVMAQPVHQPRDGMSDASSTYTHQNAYPPARQGSVGTTLVHPSTAYTQEPGPTPKYSDTYYSGPSNTVDRPAQAQSHPGES